MRILVTGADGFVGGHLCRALAARGDEVIAARGGAARAGEAAPVDIVDAEQVSALVARSAPEAVVNLAGASSVGQSHRDPRGALLVNALGTLNVLTALKAHAPRARVLIIGSGEVYGATAPGARAREDAPLEPMSPYASSKLAAEALGRQFARAYGMDVVVVRPFNHIGPGQAETFVLPSFARQLAAIERGEQPPELLVGNLEAVRDFSHVLDVIDAYALLLARGAAGEVYNVCGGRGYSIRQLLDLLVAAARVRPTIQVDPTRLRQGDEPALIGDPTKLEALGWSRQRSVEQAVREVLEAARQAAVERDAPAS